MKVLAFDIASNTGCAVGEAGGTPICWSVDIGKGKSDALRFSTVLKFTEKCINHYKPDIIAVECAIGGVNSSQFLTGAFACVIGTAAKNKIQIERYTVASIRKHFLGKHLTAKRDFAHLKKKDGKAAIKQCVIDRCGQLGWSVSDDDAADAAALWDFCCAKQQPNHKSKPIGGLFDARNHQNGSMA